MHSPGFHRKSEIGEITIYFTGLIDSRFLAPAFYGHLTMPKWKMLPRPPTPLHSLKQKREMMCHDATSYSGVMPSSTLYGRYSAITTSLRYFMIAEIEITRFGRRYDTVWKLSDIYLMAADFDSMRLDLRTRWWPSPAIWDVSWLPSLLLYITFLEFYE